MSRPVLKFLSWLFALCFPLCVGATIANPDPGTYGPDDGSFRYTPAVETFFFEAFDVLPLLGVPASFGFYRVADPTTRITVFDAADQGPPDQIAYAHFLTGGIIDIDAGAVQGAFVPGLGPIGFYLELIIGGLPLTIFSDPALNAGFDLMAAFPNLGVPDSYLLGVELPDGADGFATVYFASISGFRATAPEPSTALLIVLALAAATYADRRRAAAALPAA